MTVFEASHRIGGLWPISKDDRDENGLVNPDMCVNQSRHTVAFSDFAWGEEKASFPKAWEVGGYLEGYMRKFGLSARLKCRVLGSERIGEGWSVRVREEEEEKVRVSFISSSSRYPVLNELTRP